jgi:hypothetical protein
MSMEQMGSHESKRVLLGNQMQAMLAEKHGEQLGNFISDRAEKFREYVNSNAEILEEFENDPELRSEKLNRFSIIKVCPGVESNHY